MKQIKHLLLLVTVTLLTGCPIEESSDDRDGAPSISGLGSGGSGSSSSFGGQGSLAFVSADPTTIGIRGTDAIANQAIVSFSVIDADGNPVANQAVNFSLNSTVGGTTLSPSQTVTNENGLATTTVRSGDVAAVVRVTAESTRNGTTATAQSSQLAITTGIPDQDSFSFSVDEFNLEGGDFDGTTTTLTIRAADRYNNPVADNTAINFTAEGGSITGSCLTTEGACSVTVTSQNPRPNDGRVTILASAVGEESFIDANPSNGRYDDAESFVDSSREAFRDDNFNGARDSNELYIDFNSNGSYDLSDGLYNGLLCNGPANCSPVKTTTVFSNAEVIFSESSFSISASPNPVNLNGGPQTVSVNVKGITNGQVPPAGTTIAATTTLGSVGTPSSFTMINTAYNPATGGGGDPSIFSFVISPAAAPGTGTLTITATTPNQVVTVANFPVTQTTTP